MPETRQRITDLHAWYTRNVMPLRLTPEVERLWFEWFKAGYNGPDLRDVIKYIRRQISLGKRNEGALKLSNLLTRTETGFMRFDEDLGLARSRRNLLPDRQLEPVPSDVPQVSKPAVSPVFQPADRGQLSDAERKSMAAQLKDLRQNL